MASGAYGINCERIAETPLATLEKGAGDCEDYAILKYLALREAGISPEDLRLVVVSHPRRGTLHAVLAVHLENDWLLLDNLTMVLVSSVEAKQYQPLLALDHHGIRTVFAGAPALGFPGTTAGPYPEVLAARSAVLLEGLRNVVSQKRTKFYHGLRRQIHKEGNLVDR